MGIIGSDADIDVLFTDTGLGKDDPRERPRTRMTRAFGANGRGRPQGGAMPALVHAAAIEQSSHTWSSTVRWAAASASFVNASGGLWRPDARFLQLLHGTISEFGAWRIATDDEHQDMLDVGIARGYVLEATNEPGREGHHVQGI